MNAKTYVDEFQLITGIDVPVPELKLTLRQPRMKEIAMLSEQGYFLALSLFKMTREELKIPVEIPVEEINNWKLLNETVNQKVKDVENPRQLVVNFMRLFCPKLNFGPRSLIIDTGGEEIINIDAENFDLFQKIICELGGGSLLSKHKGEDFNPVSAQAAAIAEKMKKAREKLAKAKGEQNKSNDGFLARFVKALTTVTANSLEDVGNMTIYQVNELMQTYLAWEAYDLDIKSRLAGAKGDSKLVHWMVRKDQNESTIGTL